MPMSESLKVTVVIPAFNEQTTLRELLPQVKSLPGVAEILVINDGSTDATRDVSEQAGARVLSHPLCRGNGAAVKTGLRHASQNWVLIVDADGQHALEEVKTLLAAPDAYDLVIGARPFRWTR